jgi:acetyl esterase/lipase
MAHLAGIYGFTSNLCVCNRKSEVDVLNHKYTRLVIGLTLLLTLFGISAVSGAETNLVVNGGFEELDASGWPTHWGKYWGVAGAPSPGVEYLAKSDGAPEGEHYLYLNDQSTAGALVIYSDPIIVKPGGTYTISIISKGKTETIYCRLRTFSKVTAGPMDTSLIVKNLASDLEFSSGDWNVSASTVTIPDNAVMARVLIYTSSAAFGSASIDRVVLTEGEVTVKPVYDVATDRYLKPVFPQVRIHEGIQFGSAVDLQGVNQVLRLDVYEPMGDTQELRPAILWLHGGGLKAGDRKQGYIGTVSMEFAKRGYVCISADYRLGTNADSELAILNNAVTDGISAYNWIVENGAKYGIDTNNIIVGGGSAGGYLAVNIGALDDASRGAFDKSRLKAILNLWGSPSVNNYIGKVDKTDPPMFTIHGTADKTVAYNRSEYLASLLTNAGVYHILYPLPGLDHTPVSEMETILEQSSQFLYKVLFPNGR